MKETRYQEPNLVLASYEIWTSTRLITFAPIQQSPQLFTLLTRLESSFLIPGCQKTEKSMMQDADVLVMPSNGALFLLGVSQS